LARFNETFTPIGSYNGLTYYENSTADGFVYWDTTSGTWLASSTLGDPVGSAAYQSASTTNDPTGTWYTAGTTTAAGTFANA
jgi:hypothetical protein